MLKISLLCSDKKKILSARENVYQKQVSETKMMKFEEQLERQRQDDSEFLETQKLNRDFLISKLVDEYQHGFQKSQNK